mgnify:CR=1 FL=1|jgi:hypothetical protein
MELRSSSPASASMTDPPLRASARSSLLPVTAHSATPENEGYGGDSGNTAAVADPSTNGSSSATNGRDSSLAASTAATTALISDDKATVPSLGGLTTTAPSPSVYAAAAEAISSPESGPYLYPYQPPDPSPPPLGNPYFMAAMSPPPQPGYPHPLQRAGPGRPPNEGMYASFGQASTASANATEEDLSYAMRGMQLGGGAGSASAAAAGQASPQYSPKPPYTHARQDSAASFQPYYLAAAASPYLAHPAEMYVTAGGMQYAPAGPGYYAAAPANDSANAAGGLARRDSITPQWGLPMPSFAFPPDFVTSPPPPSSSRQGSFSFAPSQMPAQAYPPGAGGPAAAPPTATFGGVNAPLTRQPPSQSQAGGGPAAGREHAATAGGSPYGQLNGPQIGQQHQIILGRGVRAGQEYVAPGPMAQHGYGMGYAPDVRQLRSPLLEEFRSNRNRSWELQVSSPVPVLGESDASQQEEDGSLTLCFSPRRQDLAGYVVEFSGDQLGSRHIQTKLDTASLEEKAMVFNEILPNMLQLSTDVFANCEPLRHPSCHRTLSHILTWTTLSSRADVIQKFFEQGSQVQKTAMAKVLEGHVLQLSLQMYGCRVVQKALEYVLVDQQVRLVKELDGHVLKCARDAQSNHVIQRALERVPPEHLVFITDACLGEVRDLATHPYGCRVLQRIFENCPPKQTRALLDELHRHVQDLVEDQFGNVSLSLESCATYLN